MAVRLLREGDAERKGAMVLALIWAAVACGVVWSAEAAVEPSAGPSGQDEQCTRPLIDVLQGFAITLLAFAVSMWGILKHQEKGLLWKLCVPLVGPCAPLTLVGGCLGTSCECVAMLWRCHNLPRGGSPWKRVFVSLLPWEKSRVRILASCDVVLYISPNSLLLQNKRFECMKRQGFEVEDESEAMVSGDPRIGYTRRQMNDEAIGALELAGVLPPYDELKFLRSNSSFAMLAIAIQAIGYIYAVVYRIITNLQVAPVEVIGLVLNIVLLINASLLSTCNPCHRPLVMYMNEEEEEKLNSFLSMDRAAAVLKKPRNVVYWASGLIGPVFLFLGVILVYYIVKMMGDVDNMITIPLVMFLVVWILGVVQIPVAVSVPLQNLETFVDFVFVAVIVLNGIIYIWATVVTVVYWNSEHFNVRAELVNLSQLIPFIG